MPPSARGRARELRQARATPIPASSAGALPRSARSSRSTSHSTARACCARRLPPGRVSWSSGRGRASESFCSASRRSSSPTGGSRPSRTSGRAGAGRRARKASTPGASSTCSRSRAATARRLGDWARRLRTKPRTRCRSPLQVRSWRVLDRRTASTTRADAAGSAAAEASLRTLARKRSSSAMARSSSGPASARRALASCPRAASRCSSGVSRLMPGPPRPRGPVAAAARRGTCGS